jgi:hypothetical protein
VAVFLIYYNFYSNVDMEYEHICWEILSGREEEPFAYKQGVQTNCESASSLGLVPPFSRTTTILKPSSARAMADSIPQSYQVATTGRTI